MLQPAASNKALEIRSLSASSSQPMRLFHINRHFTAILSPDPHSTSHGGEIILWPSPFLSAGNTK